MIISRLLASTTAHLPFVRVGKAAVCQARVQLPDCNQRLATELTANKRSQTMGTNALSLGTCIQLLLQAHAADISLDT